MADIKIENLCKNFGKAHILKNINLEVGKGEFVALVGPSGCGKSTLLRLIAGLEMVTSGRILIEGQDATHLPPKARDVAMVFQNYALYPHLSVRANIGFSLKMRKVHKDIINKKVVKAADSLGLSSLLDHYPAQLSGGQRQRVATGRAIVRDPKLFLFDEPLSNLDAKLRVQMRTEIKLLHQRLSGTIIYVTHDQIEAMTLADRIVVMRAGQIEQEGAPLDLYDCPANIFVAGFLGSPAMNFIKGQVRSGALIVGQDIALPLPCLNSLEEGREIVWGVRPEALFTDGKGFCALVEVVEHTGPDTQILARLGNQTFVVLLHSRLQIKAGEQLKLAVAADDIHLFDIQTGTRIS